MNVDEREEIKKVEIFFLSLRSFVDDYDVYVVVADSFQLEQNFGHSEAYLLNGSKLHLSPNWSFKSFYEEVNIYEIFLIT